jgi:hypothetical protein
MRRRTAVFGLVVVAAAVLVALCAAWIAPYDPLQTSFTLVRNASRDLTRRKGSVAARVVTGKEKDRTSRALLVGRFDDKKKGVYAMRPGEPSVLLIPEPVWNSLPRTVAALRNRAEGRGFLVGAAVDPSLLSGDSYAETLGREFNLLVAENDMKFGPIHPAPARYNFCAADQLMSAHSHRDGAVQVQVVLAWRWWAGARTSTPRCGRSRASPGS